MAAVPLKHIKITPGKPFYNRYKRRSPLLEGINFFVLGVVVAFILMFSPDNGRLDFQGLVWLVSKDLEKRS